jgi:hypothetical protein
MKLVIDIPEAVYKCVMDGTYCGTLYEELKNGVPVDTSGDYISRQAAYDEIIWNSDNGVIDAKVAIEALRKLPSVEPERKTGKWIYTENHCWICSECGKNPLKGTGFTPTLDGMRIQWKFCNICGTKMEVQDGK